MFKEIYRKSIELAGHKRSKFFLGFISFIESFIFPIPPDVFIVPMTIARRAQWIRIALIATIGVSSALPGSHHRSKVSNQILCKETNLIRLLKIYK